MGAKVYCPHCGARMIPGRVSAKSKLDDHVAAIHTIKTPVPLPRPTDEEAKPDGYEDEVCLVCNETVRRPTWRRSSSGGSDQRVANALAGSPRRVSEFWTKRRVVLETSSWVGYSFNARHYYFVLKEDDDDVLVRDRWSNDETYYTTVFNVPYGDRGRGRDVRDQQDCYTRPAAIQAAIKKYLEEFGCETHYLVLGGFDQERRIDLVKEIAAKMRDGD